MELGRVVLYTESKRATRKVPPLGSEQKGRGEICSHSLAYLNIDPLPALYGVESWPTRFDL